MVIYVDIDGTICNTINGDYANSIPIYKNIKKVNRLFEQGHKIVYWTARGGRSGKDYTLLTKEQLAAWDCKYHNLIMNDKPSYDLLICDKTKRIEEV